jgi:hypothetical protein
MRAKEKGRLSDETAGIEPKPAESVTRLQPSSIPEQSPTRTQRPQ